MASVDNLPEAPDTICICILGLGIKPSPHGYPILKAKSCMSARPGDNNNTKEEENEDEDEEEHMLSSYHVPAPLLMA